MFKWNELIFYGAVAQGIRLASSIEFSRLYIEFRVSLGL